MPVKLSGGIPNERLHTHTADICINFFLWFQVPVIHTIGKSCKLQDSSISNMSNACHNDLYHTLNIRPESSHLLSVVIYVPSMGYDV